MIAQNSSIEIRKKIGEIEEKSTNGDYIYRGEPRCYEKVSSTLYRGCQQAATVSMEKIQQQLLNQAKAYDVNRLGLSQSQNYYFSWSAAMTLPNTPRGNLKC